RSSDLSPPLSRMTTGASSLTYATRLFVVPRSMPTTLLISRRQRQLPLDPRQQVADVIPLQHAVAERLKHRLPIRRRRVRVDQRVPASGDLLELRFVLRALLFNRRAGPPEPRLPLIDM